MATRRGSATDCSIDDFLTPVEAGRVSTTADPYALTASTAQGAVAHDATALRRAVDPDSPAALYDALPRSASTASGSR